MNNLKNDLIIRAALGKEVERVPVWLMRQAGRTLPEYKAVRAKAKNFIEFVKNPEMAAEVTVQPVDILGVDAAIIFSDILVIPEAMGLPYQMIESKGPAFDKIIETQSDVNHLKISEAEDLSYVIKAIELTKKQLDNRVPLIGFCGAPWTLLAYMTEGGGSKTFSKAKKFLYTEPKLAHQALEKIALSSINYLNAQIDAGANMVQIFDSWAGALSPQQYNEFSLRYISMICDGIKNRVPVTVFAKDAHYAVKDIASINCNTIGLDWTMNPAKARLDAGANKTLQGNADPCLLYANEETIQKETISMLKQFGKQNYIANLGHGLYPDTEKSKIKFFVDTIKSYSFN